MADESALRAGVRVRLTNPTRNTERSALARFGDVWVVRGEGVGPVRDGKVLVAPTDDTFNNLPDLRWWAVGAVEAV